VGDLRKWEHFFQFVSNFVALDLYVARNPEEVMVVWLNDWKSRTVWMFKECFA